MSKKKKTTAMPAVSYEQQQANYIAKTDRRVLTVRTLFSKMAEQIRVALPKHLDTDRFIRICMTSLQTKPDLLDCDPVSFISASMQCAQLGLEPDSTLKHCHLVPFNNRVQIILGYRGIVRLAMRSGEIAYVVGECVYSNDRFIPRRGTQREILHEAPLRNRGELIGAYAIAYLKNAPPYVPPPQVVIGPDDVARAKSSAQATDKSTSPWNINKPAMWAKTAIRRLEPQLPLDAVAAKGFDIDARGERGEEQYKPIVSGDVADLITLNPDGEPPRSMEDLNDTMEAAAETLGAP